VRVREYLLVNDIHLADRPPSSCTDTYTDDLFDLLDQVIDLVHDRDAAALILAGDIFHFKTPSRTSHRTVRRLIDTLGRCHRPTLIVPGNHDLQHDRLDSLDETQPLGVVFASGAAHQLLGWSAVDAGWIEDPVYGVPWLMRFEDDLVRDALDDWRTRLQSNTPGLVVTHAPLYPPGQELPYEYYPTSAWAKAMNSHGTVHYGHVHEAHGIYRVDDVTFSNPGALSRGSLHEHNLTRQIAIGIWNSGTGQISHRRLDHKPADQVFRLTEAAVAHHTQVRLDDFLASIGQTRLEVTSIESVLAHIRSLGLGHELETLIDGLLHEGTPA
jgi:Icc-related predicted phosphoesterase